jgi:broad specificity phosphatase PhoE
VRHGETDWNADGRCQGTSDVPLNARGIEQIASLTRRLAGVPVHAAYASPLGRARHAADLLLAGRGMSGEVVPELTELSYGELTGTTPGQWSAELRQRWAREPWDVRFDGGESLADVHSRAAPAWDRIVGEHAGETVLVVAHGHLNRVLLLHATAGDRSSFWDIQQLNGDAVTVRGTSVVSFDAFLSASTPDTLMETTA